MDAAQAAQCTCTIQISLSDNVLIAVLMGQVSASEESKEALQGILGGRPVLALAFDNMEMRVNKPAVVPLTTERREEELPMQPALAWAMAN